MTRLRDTIDRTPEYVNFIKELREFHEIKGTTLQAEPILGKRRLDLYKIFHAVVSAGGFDEVTKNRGWKQVGDIFQFPSTCTNSAYILKGIYIRNLLGWEEEKVWNKTWTPPKELLGPHAHRLSNLAGKAYKPATKKSPKLKSSASTTQANKTVKLSTTMTADVLFGSLNTLPQLGNPLLIDLNANPPIYTNQINNPPTQPQLQTVPQLQEELKQETIFNEKDRILFALQFGQKDDVEWALDQIVTISFECPEKLELSKGTAFLLELLVLLAQPCLVSHAADNALPTCATDTLERMLKSIGNAQVENMDAVSITPTADNDGANTTTNYSDSDALNIILKVLHILRNFSLIADFAPTLAKYKLVKELLIQGLQTSMSTGHVELGRHSMDVLENIAFHMELTSTEDPCLAGVQTVVAAHDRYLVISSIRTLTWFTMNKANHAYLESCPVIVRISQMLLSNDEELVGTSLEYIYQHTKISLKSRTQFLTSPHSSAYVGLLISLLMTKSKYFCTRFIHEDHSMASLPSPTYSGGSPDAGALQQPEQQQPQPKQAIIPHVPDLTVYHNLDEPYRCLGWLKDKFEVADRSSVLSLDDIYLLYEARFGLEKALKMRDFYTVMKIAFPKASTSGAGSLLGSAGHSSPVVEGLNIVGIQIKMSILQDRSQVPCKWEQCSLLFDDTFSLQRHILHDHMKPITTSDDINSTNYICGWSHCTIEQNLFSNKNDWISHLRTHFYNEIGESRCNSPIQSPELSLSLPSTPTSNISSSSTLPCVDNSNIQGIALVVSHLLDWLSKDPQSMYYFIPYEKELSAIAEQRPKLACRIWSICSNFRSSQQNDNTSSIATPTKTLDAIATTTTDLAASTR
ncbi:MAG: hypothetical protein EXX96DRAFT_548443 [Benjaminiella poitrasii]|nr:MAG: hypothetical protein EXX96DRAFT_548443 [Benjaminiella poitrasii]